MIEFESYMEPIRVKPRPRPMHFNCERDRMFVLSVGPSTVMHRRTHECNCDHPHSISECGMTNNPKETTRG